MCDQAACMKRRVMTVGNIPTTRYGRAYLRRLSSEIMEEVYTLEIINAFVKHGCPNSVAFALVLSSREVCLARRKSYHNRLTSSLILACTPVF